jgi:DNA modification methylase
MDKMDKQIKKEIIELIEKGETIPEDYQEDLFPAKKKEYELMYAGKERAEKILNDTLSVPFQPIKHFGDVKDGEWSNMLIFGDNLQSLKHLLKLKEEGKLKNSDGTDGVKLIYIDPPFGTGDSYDAKGDRPAYSAKLQGVKYLEYIRKRLILLKEILSSSGLLVLRIDYHFGHYLKILMDEIFGKNNFKNEMVINRIYKNVFGDSKFIPTSTDNLFIYSGSENTVYSTVLKERAEKREAFWRHMDDSAGHRNPPERVIFGKTLMPPRGKHFKYNQEAIDKMIDENRIRFKCGNCGTIHLPIDGSWKNCKNCKADSPRLQYLVKESHHENLQSNWTDIPGYSHQTKYPTENSEILLERVIVIGSNPGDIVLDCFAGSGTTGAVAEKLGRKWIMCDCGKLSIYTIQKRMMELKEEMGNKGKPLKHKPYTLYHAGLYYEGEILEKMQNGEYKDFVLELFGCQKRNHKLNGVDFHGTLNNHSVMIFNKENYLTYDFIEDLHKNVGSSVKDEVHIIAPVGVVGFNEDYIKKGKIKYIILRIPNSIIDYIRQKDFTKLEQPRTSEDVNQTIDAVGFDFIYPPNMKVKYSIEKQPGKLSDKEYTIEIKEFDPVQLGSKIVEFNDPKSEALSMVMVDVDYDGETFDLDKYYFGEEIAKNKFKVYLGDKIGKQTMIIYIDIFGNEKKEIVKREEFK